jgi:hypothetical protein
MKEQSTSVFDNPDFKKLSKINDELLDENSHLGKIISTESLRKGSKAIQRAIQEDIVNHGAGALVRR